MILLLADGGYQGIDLQRAGLGGLYRAAAALFIGFAESHNAQRQGAIGVKLFRVVQKTELNAISNGFFILLTPRRHLLL